MSQSQIKKILHKRRFHKADKKGVIGSVLQTKGVHLSIGRAEASGLVSYVGRRDISWGIPPKGRGLDALVVTSLASNAAASATEAFTSRVRQKLINMRAAHKIVSFGELETDEINGEIFVEMDVHIPRADWLQDGGLEVMSSLTELEQEGYILTPRIYPASEERAI